MACSPGDTILQGLAKIDVGEQKLDEQIERGARRDDEGEANDGC